MSEKKEADFESTLAELERVVEGLENGELSLAEQLKAFERGMELSEQCKNMLDEARLKVIELTENDDSEGADDES
ncbi:MAG: exodeoxyribonuclease VII small subunit [Gammaproteobacteria bacterium]|nr:exodeoxyribonuclease VII small subunit [Gammaproteobacteria bacterium]